ncbi:hypothetical protein FJ656_26200 [Schumannella luteola]|nr:hypothetical protein FJ656_26200 [Schumannella luteola]
MGVAGQHVHLDVADPPSDVVLSEQRVEREEGDLVAGIARDVAEARVDDRDVRAPTLEIRVDAEPELTQIERRIGDLDLAVEVLRIGRSRRQEQPARFLDSHIPPPLREAPQFRIAAGADHERADAVAGGAAELEREPSVDRADAL